jgi:hypothetical protein
LKRARSPPTKKNSWIGEHLLAAGAGGDIYFRSIVTTPGRVPDKVASLISQENEGRIGEKPDRRLLRRPIFRPRFQKNGSLSHRSMLRIFHEVESYSTSMLMHPRRRQLQA